MRILVFSWRDTKHPLAGGAEQVMHEHMKRWVRAGHQVTLFSSKLKNQPKEEAIDGVYIVRQGIQYLGVQIKGFFYYLRNKKEFDLVVDQFHGLPFFTPVYVRKAKLAVIQETAREVWFLNPLPHPINLLVGLLGFIIEPFIFLLYKNIVFMTGSKSAKDDVVKFGIPIRNINIVPHGVITYNVSPSIKKEKKLTIVFLGILSKDKGIEDALKCFKILKEKKHYQFWVIGKSETEHYRKSLEKLVASLGLNKDIKFWGYISQEKKFELLKKAHVLINPSAKEGWGLVNIEANTVGTPVVAYRSQGLIDSVCNNKSGVLCQSNNPEYLASNIFELLDDKFKYKKMQKDALSWSKKFTWKVSSKKSTKLLNKILNNS